MALWRYRNLAVPVWPESVMLPAALSRKTHAGFQVYLTLTPPVAGTALS